MSEQRFISIEPYEGGVFIWDQYAESVISISWSEMEAIIGEMTDAFNKHISGKGVNKE